MTQQLIPTPRTPAEFLAEALEAQGPCAGLTTAQQRRAGLYLVLGLVDLDEAEQELVDWLAQLDQPKVEAAASLFAKLARAC